MPEIPKYTIFPISDSALTIDFGNVISESINYFVLSLFHAIKTNPPAGMIEAVPAYSSLTLYYDLFFLRKQIPSGQTAYDWIAGQLLQRLNVSEQENNISPGLVTIPVCYDKEFAPDIEYLAREKIFLLMNSYIFTHPDNTGFSCWVFFPGLAIWEK